MTTQVVLDRVHRRAATNLLEHLRARRRIRRSFPSQQSHGAALRHRILSGPRR